MDSRHGVRTRGQAGKMIRVGFVLLFFFANIYTFPLYPNSPSRLFDSDDILEVKISASISKICKDRGENKIYHPGKITYKQKDGTEITPGILKLTIVSIIRWIRDNVHSYLFFNL